MGVSGAKLKQLLKCDCQSTIALCTVPCMNIKFNLFLAKLKSLDSLHISAVLSVEKTFELNRCYGEDLHLLALPLKTRDCNN